MSVRFRRLFIFTVSFFAGLCAVPPLWSQNPSSSEDCPCPLSQSAPHPSVPDFSNAANKWQLTAVNLESQVDTVNPILREQRDTFWKVPLETYRDEKKAAEVAGGAMFTSPGAYSADGPEFSAVKGATWVLATFEDFHVYAIGRDYELLYTETPARVVIDEAVELAKRFGGAQSAQFVNGILDHLMHKGKPAPDPTGLAPVVKKIDD